MIIILDRSDLTGRYATVPQQAPLLDLEPWDFWATNELPEKIYDAAHLVIITDKEERKYRVFKDDTNVFETNILYSLHLLEMWLVRSINILLRDVAPEEDDAIHQED